MVNKSQASRKTWETLSKAGILYCRTKESLKNFWKKWREYKVEEWIDQIFGNETKYSHNYSEPIYPYAQLPSPKEKKGK